MDVLIMNGVPQISEVEIRKHFLSKADCQYVNLLNPDGTINGSDYVEREFSHYINRIKADGKKIVKVVAQIYFCDESELEEM